MKFMKQTLGLAVVCTAALVLTGCHENNKTSVNDVPPPSAYASEPPVTVTPAPGPGIPGSPGSVAVGEPSPFSSGATSGGRSAAPAPGSAATPAPQPAPYAAPPANAAGSYTIVRGDTLWAIAKRHYGNGQRWVDIAKANPSINPNKLHVGDTIVLP